MKLSRVIRQFSGRKTDLAEARLRQAGDRLQQIKELMMFGLHYKPMKERINYEEAILAMDRNIAKCRLLKIQLENLLTQMEAQKDRLELRQMQKESGIGSDNGDGK